MESLSVFDNFSFANDEKPSSNLTECNISSITKPSQPKEETYNPYDYGNTDKPTSFWGTAFHLIIISAGPSILTIPRTFVAIGNVTGFILIFLVVLLYACNMKTLVACEYEICKIKRIPNMSYPEMVKTIFKNGPSRLRWFAYYGKCLCYVIFVIIWFSASSCNFILISENLQTVYYNLNKTEIDIRTFLIIIFFPLLLLLWIPKLSYLVPVSFLGIVFNGLSLIFVIYYLFSDSSSWHTTENNFGEFSKIPLFLGAIFFTLNATGIIMPLKNDMRYPKKFNSTFGVLTMSYVPISLLYSSFSLLCCLKYGKNIHSNVIENLPDDLLATVANISSTLSLIFQFPLFLYVCFDMIWNNMLKKKKKMLIFPVMWEYVLRTALVILSFLFAYNVPNVSVFLLMCGTVGTSLDSLIFPALMHTIFLWQTNKDKCKHKFTFFKNACVITLGLVLVITGIYDCVVEILDT